MFLLILICVGFGICFGSLCCWSQMKSGEVTISKLQMFVIVEEKRVVLNLLMGLYMYSDVYIDIVTSFCIYNLCLTATECKQQNDMQEEKATRTSFLNK